MMLLHGLDSMRTPFARSTVAIGTFDGIHLGHQAIIREAVADARAHDRPSLVFTFDRHPAELLAPERAPEYLTTPEQRNSLVAALGIDALVVAAFDPTLAALTPDEFLESVLKERLGAEAIVVGSNFTFGRDRAGDARYLEAAQSRYGFALRALEPVIVKGVPASSTRIRDLLRSGSISEAEAVLGHPYRLAGTVVEGQKLGRTLGYPTANLERSVRQVVPQDGIYAVLVRLAGGQVVKGACSIGDRPTVEGAGRSIETYLIDFNADLYGQPMEIEFVRRIREERRFESLEALTAQMALDVDQARELLATADSQAVSAG